MKHFDSDTFLDIARTLKLDEQQRAFLPEFRMVLIKAIWEVQWQNGITFTADL